MSFYLKIFETPVHRKRQAIQTWIRILDLSGCYLNSGLDLSYGWRKAFEAEKKNLSIEFQFKPEESLLDHLKRLALLSQEQTWITPLQNLYSIGSPVGSYLANTSQNLKDSMSRDLENHLQKLPSKVNLGILIFFLPVSLLLLMLPLLSALNYGAF